MMLTNLTYGNTLQPHLGVIWFHGLGATADDLVPLAQQIHSKLDQQDVHFFAQAKSRPVSLCGGQILNSWYNLHGLSFNSLEDVSGMSEAISYCSGELKKLFSQYSSIKLWVLAGFSQGAAMANLLARQAELPIGGVMMFSGYWPNPTTQSKRSHLPLFACHGLNDPVVPYQALSHVQHMAYQSSWKGTFYTDQSAFHYVSPMMLSHGIAWLQCQLSSISSGQ